ncbi:MAG: DUF2807 domain-containing protein [Bacteroidales bacterium]|nr:DUF2807 domain-containing protein [Bacteroidales bacterium]MCF8389616.1 DUF2807 domain-containing protein [Bacteroidales bacterium]
MKSILKGFLIIGLLMIGIGIFAQETEKREIESYHSISIIGKIRCELYKSEKAGLEVIAKGTDLANVITENVDGTLSLRLKTSTPKEAEIKIKLYYTELDEIDVQSQSLITSPEVLKGEKMIFNSRAGGKIELELDLTSLEADAKQGGSLVFSGLVDKQEVKVSTGGAYSAYELKSNDAYVVANSGGKAKVSVSRIIDANASSKAFIGYKGTPVSTYIKTNLGGEIAHHSEDEDSDSK